MKTGLNWESRTECTGTPLTCTGTHSVLEGCTGTHSRCTGTHSRCTGTHYPKMPRMCIFSPFSICLIPNSTQYFIYTSKPFQIHLEISFLFNSSLNYISFFKILSRIPQKIIPIWVMTHTQTKHDESMTLY